MTDFDQGLKNADEQKRKDMASKGGKANHEERGDHGTDHNDQNQDDNM